MNASIMIKTTGNNQIFKSSVHDSYRFMAATDLCAEMLKQNA